jgi:glyceraldehyde-3-phosphate dehydrogenase (NADP+)
MKMLIAGKWVDRDKKINVCKPYDGEVIDTVPAATAEDVDAAITAAVKGFDEYKRYPSHKRIEILFKAAELMRGRQEEYARTIATEGSKTIREARG